MEQTAEEIKKEIEQCEERVTELKRVLAQKELATKTHNVKSVRDLMSELGVSLADLTPADDIAPTSAPGKNNRGTKPGKLPAMYRDTANPENTWTGKGAPSKWLRAYVAQGRDREEFLIDNHTGLSTSGEGHKAPTLKPRKR